MPRRRQALQSPRPNAYEKVAAAAVCATTLGVLALYLRTLTYQSLWFDEGLSVTFAGQPLPQLFDTLVHQDLHPPLYYLLLHCWMALAGRSEWAVRLPSALAAVMLVPLTYATVREVSGDAWRSKGAWAVAGVVASALIATSPFLAYYAQETRMYSLAASLSLAATWAFLRAARRGDARSWYLFGILLSAALYTQYFSVFLIPAFLIHALFLDRRLLRQTAASTALALGLYLPWLGAAYQQLGRLLRLPDYWVGTHINLTQFADTLVQIFAPNASAGLAVAAVLAAGALLLRLAHQRRYQLTERARRSGLVFLTLLLPLVLTYAAVTVAPKFAARYTIAIIAPAYICAALLVYPILNHRATWPRVLLGFAVIGAIVVSFASTLATVEGRQNQRDDVRGLAAYLANEAQSDDAILLVENAPYALNYYYHGDAPVYGLHVGLDFDSAVGLLNHLLEGQARRVWLVLWHHEFADPTDFVVTELLRVGGETPIHAQFQGHELRAFDINLHSQALQACPQPQTPLSASFSQGLLLHGFDLFSNEQGQLHYVFYWEAPNQLSADYRLTLTLQDSDGGEYLRKNQALCTDYFLPPAWPIDTPIYGRVDLDLPADLPAITYRAHLQVLDPGTQRNLDVVDERGAPLGQKLFVGDISPAKTILNGPVPQIRNPLGLDLGNGLHLIGSHIGGESHSPGDALKLTLWLQRTGALMVDAGIHFRLVDATGLSVWQTHRAILPEYPPSQWHPEETNRVVYSLLLPPELPGGDYTIQVGTERAWSTLEELPIAVRTHRYDTPPMEQAVDLQFEKAINLLGYDLIPSSPAAGEQATVRLYWQAGEPLDASYKVSVQLLSSEQRIASQSDNIPVSWTYPTTAWLPGEIIVDEHILPIQRDAEPGDYALIVVLYEEQSGQRLLVEQSGTVTDHATLATFSVAP